MPFSKKSVAPTVTDHQKATKEPVVDVKVSVVEQKPAQMKSPNEQENQHVPKIMKI